MHCMCGHDERDHVHGGRCRVPDCPCERFQPVPEIAGNHRFAPRAVWAASALRRILSGGPRPAGDRPFVPLARVVVCLDCEACFALGVPRCPACGSQTWTLVARFLEPRAERVPAAVRLDRALVS